MKPAEARARRQNADRQKASGEAGIREYIANGGHTLKPMPAELRPTEQDLTVALRECRKLIRMAERAPRGRKRTKVLDRLIGEMQRLIYVERVLALDPLQRAALTPAAAIELARVSKVDLIERRDRWTGESEIEVA